MEHYDLVIIGGGPAGYAGAMRALDFGKKVLLIEKNKLGGAGVYAGVLASKTMWEYSQKIATIKKEIPEFEFCFNDVKKVLSEAIFERKTQLMVHLNMLKGNHSIKGSIAYEKGLGKIIDCHTVEIKKEQETTQVSTQYILLCTGSRPRLLPNILVDEKNILTSDGIHNLNSFPESMVILGAGVIGCEYATIFSNFGKTKVNLIDKADRILPFEDEDISQTVTTNLENNGATIHKNASLQRMEITNGKVEYELKYTNNKTEIITVEKAIISVGRVPNTEHLGLENINIKLCENGKIWESDTQTSISNIFVAGDISSNIALVNTAEREARHAVVRMFGAPVKPLNYNNISTIMFLNPEVAAVGLNEQQARSKGIPFKVAKIDYSCIARATAMRKTNGFFKLLVTADNGMRIIGMRAVGEHASSAIQAVAVLMDMNKGVEELSVMLHPHPSIIEGIQECTRMLLGKSIYKPPVFKDKLKCYCYDNGCYTEINNL
ncbi:MAG: NAD(P)/FAD-dependent oxidoreductase [Bacteroidia bacterium]|nr:NAD(P)/FAD-dependent oxidoreductase [Bacteroidia bacterium]